MITTTQSLSSHLVALAQLDPVVVDINPRDGTVTTHWLGKPARSAPSPAQIEEPLLKLVRDKAAERVFVGVHAVRDPHGRQPTYFAVYCSAFVGHDRPEVLALIGGDRIEFGKTPEEAVSRASELAEGMLEKSSAIAGQQLPEFCGGKKGVMVLLDDNGTPIEVPENETDLANATAAQIGVFRTVAPKFILTVNSLLAPEGAKDQRLALASLSPDARTGTSWAENCRAFAAQGLRSCYFTCAPADMGGFSVPSACPTAAGVDEVAEVLARLAGLDLAAARYVFDGGGLVSEYHLQYLARRGVPGKNVVVVDPDAGRESALRGALLGIRFVEGTLDRAVGTLAADVLIINNPGNITTAATVQTLIDCGLKVVVGGANNLFRLDEEAACADNMANAGVKCVPSPLQNGGGWAMAAVGQLAIACGVPRAMLEPHIEGLSRRLHRAAVQAAAAHAEADGVSNGHVDLYRAGQDLIDRRVSSRGAQPRDVRTILRDLLGSDAPGGGFTGWDRANAAAMSTDLWGVEPIPFIDNVLRSFAAAKVKKVLEVGPGSGRNTAAFAGAGFAVTGVDISPASVTVVSDRLRCAGLHADVRVGDMLNLPFNDNEFDAAIHLDCLGQVENPREALVEACRVLRPGGLIALNLFTLNDGTFGEGKQVGPNKFVYKDTLFAYYTPKEAVSLVVSAGFEILDERLVRWDDPPHGEFRPRPHSHENTVIIARKLVPASKSGDGPTGRAVLARSGLVGLQHQVGGTPLIQVQLTLADGRRVDAAIKAEGMQLGGSAKARAVAGTIMHLQHQGLLGDAPSFVSSTSGNFGKAAAIICSAAGWPVHLVLDPKCTVENIESAQRHGATVEIVRDADPHGNYLAARLARVRSLVEREGMIELDQYNSPGVPVAHSLSLGVEIFRQSAPDIVFVAVSTGGTYAGIVAAARMFSRTTVIKPVDVYGSLAFDGGVPRARHLSGVGSSRRSTFVNPAAGDVLRVPERAAVAGCHLFEHRLGIRIGGSAGAVLVAASGYLNDHPEFRRPLLVFHDLGGYASTVYNEAWLLNVGLKPTRDDALPLVNIAA